jgi:carboxyl-terminal processing protease
LLVAGFLLPGCTLVPSPRFASPVTPADVAARNEAVYDRTVQVVAKRFFDEKFNGRAWEALAEAHRPAALAALDTEAFYRELNALFGELDVSHLVALTPRDVRESDERRRARIGLDWHRYGDVWVVERVVPESPAAEAGVQPGWVAVSINGKPLDDHSPLRLGEGEAIGVVFRDNQDQLQSRTLRARMLTFFTPPSERILDDGIVVLRFDIFERETRRWLSDALKRHAQAKGVVLDLRRNHGGQLFSLDIVVGELFAKPVAIGRWIWRGGDFVNGRGRQWAAARYSGPLAVLIDDSTYSAAEVLAHVLQHHGRARLYGRTTGGAVIAARSFGLPDGGRLDVPVIDYVGLDGKRLEKRGVKPDVEVPHSLEALRAGRDLDLEAALADLRK